VQTRTVLRSWGLLAVGAALAASVTLATVLAVVVAAPTRDAWTPGAVAIVVGLAVGPLVVGARWVRQSIVVTADAVVVRNFLRTYRLPRASVSRVSTAAYRGWLLGPNSRALSILELSASTGVVTAFGLTTTREGARVQAGRLRTAIGLPPTGSDLGRPEHLA
jgi:hypothetical protein